MEQKQRKIRTEYVYPPIPIRQFDWSAAFDNYEPGCPIGWGRTKEEAVADLIEQADFS
jgi:hypothetical protein